MQADLFVKKARQLVTPLMPAEFGPAQLHVLADGAVASLKGQIVAVGQTAVVEKELELTTDAIVVDATGMTVTPGLIDCHTHPVFSATRENEFEMRVTGKTYEQIAAAGGGIRASVRSLRQTSKEELFQAVLPRLESFLAHGTTTIEAKSGYGLSVADEIKSLEILDELDRSHPLEVVPTFLGAHEIPDEYRDRKEDYIALVIGEMLPRVQAGRLAEFCDIFCETNVFSAAESQRILQVAKDAGLKLKIHADQLSRNGGAAVAAELGAISADHLEYTTEEDWQKMLQNRVVPVLLPGAVFFIKKEKYAPARQMLAAGLPVAVSTDFNPGTCMCESLPMMMTLSCLYLGLSHAEALAAVTLHAALAIDRGNLLGSLEVGKKADLVVWDIPNYKHLAYHFGVNLARIVIKNGVKVYESP